MRLTVLGGCGAWPGAGQACSGYLVESHGFRVLVDPGYSTLPRLLEHVTADEVDAVFVTHGHPDHCSDLNPLLRARALRDEDFPPVLPVYAPPTALDAVLALDRPGMLADAYTLHEFTPGDRLEIGPFAVDTLLLPHYMPNAGVRLSAEGVTLAYTGDTGPSPALEDLARGADLLLSEASYVDRVPDDSVKYLFSARRAGRVAADGGSGRLVLTHLMPGTDATAAREAAAATYDGPIDVATGGLVIDLS